MCVTLFCWSISNNILLDVLLNFQFEKNPAIFCWFRAVKNGCDRMQQNIVFICIHGIQLSMLLALEEVDLLHFICDDSSVLMILTCMHFIDIFYLRVAIFDCFVNKPCRISK